jgi:hypothetical protein
MTQIDLGPKLQATQLVLYYCFLYSILESAQQCSQPTRPCGPFQPTSGFLLPQSLQATATLSRHHCATRRHRSPSRTQMEMNRSVARPPSFIVANQCRLMWTSTPAIHNQISCPITQAHARQLNNQVSSFLASYSSYLDNGNMRSVLLLRNDGHERNRVAFAPVTFGFQNNSRF